MLEIDNLIRVVAEYEVPSIEMPDDVFGPINFVIQILLVNEQQYFARVLRKEVVYVEPAYSGKPEQALSKTFAEVRVPDDLLGLEEVAYSNLVEALQGALQRINAVFYPDAGT